MPGKNTYDEVIRQSMGLPPGSPTPQGMRLLPDDLHNTLEQFLYPTSPQMNEGDIAPIIDPRERTIAKMQHGKIGPVPNNTGEPPTLTPIPNNDERYSNLQNEGSTYDLLHGHRPWWENAPIISLFTDHSAHEDI
jgi:hypothetical protein